MHFHWRQNGRHHQHAEGNLVIELYNSTPDEDFADSPVTFKTDGIERSGAARWGVVLTPGKHLPGQGVYHRFYGEPGKRRVLVGGEHGE